MDASNVEPVVNEREATVLPFPTAPRHGDRARVAPESTEAPRLREVIGDVIRDERHAQGRTLAEVADEANVSLPYLSEIERGLKEVSSDLLAAVCDALEIPLPEVLERSALRLRVGTPTEPRIQLRAA